MAGSALQLDVGLTGPALPAGLPPISALRRMQGLLRETGEFEGLGQAARKVWYRKSQAFLGKDGMPSAELQELFSDSAEWWDNRRSNMAPWNPDCKHTKFKIVMWLTNVHERAWVDPQLATGNAARPPESFSSSVRGQAVRKGHLEVEMYSQLCEDRPITEVVDTLHRLVQGGCHVPNNLFYRVLKRCIGHKDLVLGRRIHALTIQSGYEGDAFLATHLICLYASHSRLEEAMQVFSNVSAPSVYNWATIISACARQGEAAQAIQLYRQMRESTVKPDNRIYSAVLKACAAAGDLVASKEVHAHILASPGEPGIFVQNGLLDMYAKCSSLEDARSVFDRLPDKDVVTWTAMIASYAQQGMGQEALSLYNSMKQQDTCQPNCVTFVCLLQACASVGIGALHQGKRLHSQIEERGLEDDVVLGGSLVNMYAKCGSLEDARSVFDRLPDKNVVTWTAMIAGYAQQGTGREAISLYNIMQQEGLSVPNSVTFVGLLQACASIGEGALDMGKKLHTQIEERGLQDDVVLGGSLVNMYAKCGSLVDARSLFDRLPDRNVVIWNTMLASYNQRGMGQEALALYSCMQQKGHTPNSVTFVCLLQACSNVGGGALRQGKQLHAQIEERGFQGNAVLSCSLVNMYAKCGGVENARKLFDRLPERDVITWTTMIGGYTQQGKGQEALSLYSRMQQEGLSPPDSCTFVCLLQACGIVAGLALGKQLHAQIQERGMQADLVVGAALVNMYAKCGSMFDSQQVFDSLPERTIEAWGALIGGYTRQGDSNLVFNLLDRMGVEGIEPNGIAFLSVLTVCSHAGLVEKGRKYFEIMRTDYGISPGVEHYTCMMDIVGRAGHLNEALQMAKTMPFPPDGAVWHTLLGACRKWNNVEIGKQAFEFAVRLDRKDAAPYVLMSNIYARAEMWEEAKEMQTRRVNYGAWKEPGQCWWTDMEGVVHTFVVGDKNHPKSDDINARLEQLVPRAKKEEYVPHLDLPSRDVPHDERECDLCGHTEKLAISYALNRTPEGTAIRVVKNQRVCEDCHAAAAYISKVEKRTILCRDSSRFHVYKDGKCSCGDYW